MNFDPNNELECVDRLYKYIIYLENLVMACSDCPADYSLTNLREDFNNEVLGIK